MKLNLPLAPRYFQTSFQVPYFVELVERQCPRTRFSVYAWVRRASLLALTVVVLFLPLFLASCVGFAAVVLVVVSISVAIVVSSIPSSTASSSSSSVFVGT